MEGDVGLGRLDARDPFSRSATTSARSSCWRTRTKAIRSICTTGRGKVGESGTLRSALLRYRLVRRAD